MHACMALSMTVFGCECGCVYGYVYGCVCGCIYGCVYASVYVFSLRILQVGTSS